MNLHFGALLALRLVWVLLLASNAQAVPGKAGRAYPPTALNQDACFTSSCTLPGGPIVDGTTYGSGTYSASFSSSDGRWSYSPRNIFDKNNNTGYYGRWLEGTYLCASAGQCTTRLSNNPAGDNYHGEWVKLSLPVGDGVGSVRVTAGGANYGTGSPTVTFDAPTSGSTATGTIVETAGAVSAVTINSAGSGYTTAPGVTFGAGTGTGAGASATAYLSGIKLQRINIWAVNANQRPLQYKLYGSGTSSGPWTVVIDATAGDIGYNANGLHTTDPGSVPSSYPYYLLVVGKCSGETLEMSELVLEDNTLGCPVATYLSGSDCASCTQGTYTPGIGATASNQCSLSCPAATYMATQGTTVCTSCSPGTYAGTAGLSSCPNCGAGKFSGNGATACTSCPPGSEPDTSKSSCITCTAGKASAGGAACTACTGTKSAAGSSSCITSGSCPAGTYLSAEACLPCAAGKYKGTSSDAACSSICDQGSYSLAGATACTSCPVATWSGTSATDGVSCCTKCAAGKKGITGSITRSSEGAACVDCTAGKFSSAAASLQCTDCPAGQYSADGSPVCTNCFAGKYAASAGLSTCTNCPIGKYSAAGATACLDCPTGFSTTDVGSATCSVCV